MMSEEHKAVRYGMLFPFVLCNITMARFHSIRSNVSPPVLFLLPLFVVHVIPVASTLGNLLNHCLIPLTASVLKDITHEKPINFNSLTK